MSRNIVITSGKGGVGKSSVTAYLGAELCKLRKKVLLIDMDEGLRSLDLMLNVSSETVFDITDLIDGNCSILQSLLQIPGCPELYLLPAPATKGAIEQGDVLKSIVSELSEMFDYILIDSPAGIGEGFYTSLSIADEALLVVNPDPVSVRDGGIVSKLLRKNGIDKIRLVINKLNTSLMIKGSFLNIDEIIDQTEVQLIAAIPTDYEIVKSSAKGEMLPPSYAKDAFKRFASRMEGAHIILPKLQKFT